MYGIFHIRSVSVGLDSQIWYLFIYITGYLNVRKKSETMDFRTFVGPLYLSIKGVWLKGTHGFKSIGLLEQNNSNYFNQSSPTIISFCDLWS